MAAWPQIIQEAPGGCPADFVQFNNAQQLPPAPPEPAGEYDFQIVHVPMRSIVPESQYFRLPYNDPESYVRLFEESRQRLSRFLESAMRWNIECRMPAFVVNFPIPQQNPAGRLLPRYDLRNFAYFVEKLNEALAEETARYAGAYYFDFDQIVATFGRRFFQDDVLWQCNHNAALTDADAEFDGERLEDAGTARAYYPVRIHEYLHIAWSELRAAYRTIRGLDMVKMVVIDLDDTLWRGVAAEARDSSSSAREGWPLGFIETLGYLKRRGILLAIVSKNDEATIERRWNELVGSHILSLDDFAVRKINWQPKPENFEQVLRDVNLLPGNVVYVDDNPVERDAIAQAFPGVRTLGGTPLLWRRILLWAPETQVASITAESSGRTEMVKAQISREEQRSKLSREEFLLSLSVQVRVTELDGPEHPSFGRALELLNKTNQYNTTGKRWTHGECASSLSEGTRFLVFEAEDKFTAYGIVGVVIVADNSIEQFVMSCRVVGLDIERAVFASVLPAIDAPLITAKLVKTESNALSQALYPSLGFAEEAGVWSRAQTTPLQTPAHVNIVSVGLPSNAT